MSGKVQVFRNGVSSGEVPAEVTNGFSRCARSASCAASGGRRGEERQRQGASRREGLGAVTGRSSTRRASRCARRASRLQGGGTPAITNANGDFTLDSLPSGTQALEVRKLGYSATEVAVELSSNDAARRRTSRWRTPFRRSRRCAPRRRADKALSDVGYLERKQTGHGLLHGRQPDQSRRRSCSAT